jgi:hypothetical protein
MKLVMVGAAEDAAVADEFTQPVSPVRLKLRESAQRALAATSFIVPPVTEATK